MKPIAVVLEQHAEEAAFLWTLRDAAVQAPHYSRKDLAALDLRLEAHLDGLRIAGPHGWSVLKEALVLEAPGEVFAAAVIAFEGGDPKRTDLVLDAGAASPDLSRGLVSAIGWLPEKKADRLVRSLLASASKDRRRVGIAGAAIRRLEVEKEFLDAVQDGDPLLRARALRALGELGYVRHQPLLAAHLGATDPDVAQAAAWSGALLCSDPAAVASLQEFAAGPGRRSRPSVLLAMRRMTPSAAAAWRERLAGASATLRQAVIGAGASGDPAAIPWLLEQMAVPALARVAGESLSTITGVDLAREELEGSAPEGFEAGPTDDPDDENVMPDPDEDLPWPERSLVRAWWDGRKASFSAGKRYLAGKEISAASVRDVLKSGLQRHRAAAALELSRLEPGTALVEVRAPGFRS